MKTLFSYKDIEVLSLDDIGYNGVYNMELALNFYGKELIVETAEFAIKVLRNYLNKRYGEA